MSQPQPISGKGHTIRVHNRSKQTISLQVAVPGGDFYLHEQQVHLMPGKSVDLPKDHARMEQITNLMARRLVSVTYDSEAAY